VRSVGFVQVADWLNSYVVKKYPDSAHCDPSTPSTFISISPVCCACVVKQ
jgi:hypothetical protein